MAEYIIKQKVTDRMGCCLANAKAEYKAAKDEFTKARFGDYISAIQAMIDVVECSEAVDVQPVKHGRWKQVSTQVDEYNNHLYECTVCRSTDRHNINVDVPYCWHCGAKMEE